MTASTTVAILAELCLDRNGRAGLRRLYDKRAHTEGRAHDDE